MNFSVRLYSFGGPQFPAPGETEVGFICVAAEVKATCWHQVLVKIRVSFLVFTRLFSCTASSCSDAGVGALMGLLGNCVYE